MLYGTDGAVIAAIGGTAGVPLDGAAAPAPASTGVTAEAADAISDIAEEAEKDELASSKAEKEFESKRLWVREVVGVGVSQYGVYLASWKQLRYGTPGRPIDSEEFYTIVGRDDLRTRYRRRRGARIGAAVGGSVVGSTLIVAGSVYLFANVASTMPWGYDDPLGMGKERVSRLSLGESGAMIGVGAAVLIGMSVFLGVFKAHPIKPEEAKALMDGYNRDLRKKLKLPAEQARLRLAPMVGRHNGLVLSGRF